MTLNKFDYPLFVFLALSIVCFCFPLIGISSIWALSIQELAVYILAVGGIFLGLSSNQSVKEGKRIGFNRFQRFAGFFIGGGYLLVGLLKLIVHLLCV